MNKRAYIVSSFIFLQNQKKYVETLTLLIKQLIINLFHFRIEFKIYHSTQVTFNNNCT